MTSIAMVTGKTPVEQNEELKGKNGFTKKGEVKWKRAGDSMGKDYQGFAPPIDPLIIKAICDGQVVIAQVESLSTPGGKHFVVITGEKWDSEKQKCRLTIADSATNSKTYLDDYKVVAVQKFGAPGGE